MQEKFITVLCPKSALALVTPIVTQQQRGEGQRCGRAHAKLVSHNEWVQLEY